MSDFYSNLNKKSPRKIRTIQPKMIVPKTDTTQFEKISLGTNRVETIISNTRRIKENEIQEWINQYNPGPLEILKRISEISLPHHNLLAKIIPELESLVSKPCPPSDIDINKIKNSKKHFLSSSASSNSDLDNKPDKILTNNSNFNFNSNAGDFYNVSNTPNNQGILYEKENEKIDIQHYLNYDPYVDSYSLSNSKQMKSKLSQILIDSHDIQISIMDKKDKIKELKRILETKKKEKEELENSYKDYQYLLKNQQFGNYEVLKKEKEEHEEFLNLSKNEKKRNKQQAEYSQIYGESKRLREEIQRITKEISENRKFQLSFAHDTAVKKIEEIERRRREEEEEKNENNF